MTSLDLEMMADLEDADATRRLQAVQCFSLTETVVSFDVFQKLSWLAKNDPVEDVRTAAENALRTTRARMRVSTGVTEKLTPEMIGSILATAEPAERQRLLSLLQQRDDASALDPIVAAIEWETDDRAIAKMLSLIGRHGGPEHVPLARKYFAHADAKVQATALETVALLVKNDPDRALLAELDRLAAEHAVPDVRFIARRLVGRLSPAPAPAPADLPADAAGVAARIGTETDVRVLAKLVMKLKELNARQHADVLKPLLKHTDPRVCANAVEALVALANEDVLPSLFPLLVREDNRLRANLMLALFPRYPDQVMGYVRRMLRSDRVSFRVSGLYCAQYLDVSQMYPAVLELAQEERDGGFFQNLIDWIEKHGPTGRARRDLLDLAAIRVDRAEAIGERLARMEAASAPGTSPPMPSVPPSATSDARPASAGFASSRKTAPYPIVSGAAAGGKTGTFQLLPPARTSGPQPAQEPRARTTGTIPRVSGAFAAPRNTASRVPVVAPDAWKKKAAMGAAAALSGLVLVAVLASRQPVEVGEATSFAKDRPVDARPHRAKVFALPKAGDGWLDLAMFGSPYRIRAEALGATPPPVGTTVWLVEPQLIREKDGTGYLTAKRFSVGDAPPTGP